MRIQKMMFWTFCMILSSDCYSQLSGLGVQSKLNIARQNYFVDYVEGKHATQKLYKFGADVYGDYQFSSAWTLRLKMGFETKGFTFSHNIQNPQTSIFKYTFNYLSTDLVINYHVVQLDPILKLYPFAGLSFGYLYNKNIPPFPEVYQPYYDFSIVNNFEDYSIFNFSAILGLGFIVKDLVWIEAELNNDLISPFQNLDLPVKNRVVAINLGLNILQIVKGIRS